MTVWSWYCPQTESKRQSVVARIRRELQERITWKECSSWQRNVVTVTRNYQGSSWGNKYPISHFYFPLVSRHCLPIARTHPEGGGQPRHVRFLGYRKDGKMRSEPERTNEKYLPLQTMLSEVSEIFLYNTAQRETDENRQIIFRIFAHFDMNTWTMWRGRDHYFLNKENENLMGFLHGKKATGVLSI